MKKLHSFAFCALITPALMLSSAAVLAQPSTDQDADREQQNTQDDRDARTGQDADREQQNTQADQDARTGQDLDREQQRTQTDQDDRRAGQSASQAADRQDTQNQSRTENRGFLNSAPMNGLQVSELMDAEVRITGDEDVGSVEDLVIDENGQVVAIVVGVGGFLGMGEKDVAIGWDDVTTSGDADELELRVDLTRESLRSAPEFEREE